MRKCRPKVKVGHVVAALALALRVLATARAATLDVGGYGPFSTIQQAVDAARPGDVLRVAAGTYVESVVIRRSVTILGGFDASHTTQDPSSHVTRVLARGTSEAVNLSRSNDVWLLFGGQPSDLRPGGLLLQADTIRRIESAEFIAGAWQIELDRDDGITTGPARLLRPRDVVFYVAGRAATKTSRVEPSPMRIRLDGLVIAGGRAARSEGAMADSGGGIHLATGNSGWFTLTRCDLIYNSAVRRGGAVSIDMAELGQCQITSNTFTHNVCYGTTESAGGGLAVQLGGGSELRCLSNQFGENLSSGDGGGADVEVESGAYVRFAGNTVGDNVALENAGGLAARLGVLSLLECADNRIESNYAQNGSSGGGYVELWGDSRAWLTNNQILSNRSELACGGLDIWVEGESRCEVSGGQVSDNEAGRCGGLRLGAQSASAIVLSHLRIASNQARSGEAGGFVGSVEQDSQLQITSATIVANHAAGDGGGFDLVAERSSSITLTGCEFAKNKTDGDCGAGRTTGLDGSRIRFTDCQFAANRADQGSNGVGSFDLVDDGFVQFDHCRFVGNHSGGDSGVGRFDFAQQSGGEIADCQLQDNTTSGSGGIGFVQATDDSLFTVRRCTISRNDAIIGFYGTFCLEGYFGSSLNFVETVFDDNQSSGPFAALYAYCDDHASFTIADCQFLRNHAEGGGYGACAIEAQRSSPVSIHSTTVAENIAGGDGGGLYVAVSGRSPLTLFDCRIHHNVALRGSGGALTVVAEDQSTVSLAATHCWANRAYGDAGAVWISARNSCPLIIEDCDWYDNIAWSEETEPVVLEKAADGWRVRPRRLSPPEPGDLITQGSLTWVIGEVESGETSAIVHPAGNGAAKPAVRAGPALLRRVEGDAGGFRIAQQGADVCILSRVRAWGNRAGRDHGAGTLTVLDTPDVQVRECSFHDNIAGRNGGAAGFWLTRVARAAIERNAFENNRAGWREDVATGGFCGGFDLSADNAGLLFFGNIIRDNRAFGCGRAGGDWGGGLFDLEEASALEFVYNAVHGNQADRDVGGLEMDCRDLSIAAVRDNPVTDNRAERDFGGLVVAAGVFSPITLEGNEFQSNRAGGCGGGLALRPCSLANGYTVSRNQFTRNEARVGSAVFVLGAAAFQNNLIADNLDDRAGAVCVAATDAAFTNDTLADNPGVALTALGGAIRSPGRLSRRGPLARKTVEIEITSPPLAALLVCARHLPFYVLQGKSACRIEEVQPTPTSGALWLRLEGSDGITTGDCEVASQAVWPVKIERIGEDWALTPNRPLPSPPQTGQHIIQGTVEHLVMDIGDELWPYRVAFDDDADLINGDAVLATPPADAASLAMTNSIIWGNAKAIVIAGEVEIGITHSDLAGRLWPGPGNISADPRFIAPPKNYRLAAGSPAIDAGTSVGAPRMDLMGVSRPLDGNGRGRPAWDMGAYEAATGTKEARDKR